MSKLNNRDNHNSSRTPLRLSRLPEWIKKGTDSTIWSVINPACLSVEDAIEYIGYAFGDATPAAFDPHNQNPTYVAGPLTGDINATYHVSGDIDIIKTQELEEFFFGPPTQVVAEDVIRPIPYAKRIPTDIHYIHNWQMDGTGESLSAFALLQENAYTDRDAFLFYDTNWTPVGMSNVDKKTQNYNNTGADEWLGLSTDGLQATLNHIPISGTIQVLNIMDLDDGGQAQPINTNFSVQGCDIVFDNPIIGSGMYIVEYDYVPNYTLRCFTPYAWVSDSYMQESPSFKASYRGVSSDDIILDPDVSTYLASGDLHSLVKLRGTTTTIHPREILFKDSMPYLRSHASVLRPGMSALVNYSGTRYCVEEWTNPTSGDFLYEVGILDDFVSTNVNMVSVFNTGGADITSDNAISISGDWVVIDSNDTLLEPVNVRINYEYSSSGWYTAETLPGAYDIYEGSLAISGNFEGAVMPAVGVPVGEVVSGAISDLQVPRFTLEKHQDIVSTSYGKEPMLIEDISAEIPVYTLDRVGQYLKRTAPLSMREENYMAAVDIEPFPGPLSGLLYLDYPEVYEQLEKCNNYLDPTLRNREFLSVRKWRKWLVLLSKQGLPEPETNYWTTSSTDTCYLNFINMDTNQTDRLSNGDKMEYEISVPNLEITSFTFDWDGNIWIVGFKVGEGGNYTSHYVKLQPRYDYCISVPEEDDAMMERVYFREYYPEGVERTSDV